MHRHAGFSCGWQGFEFRSSCLQSKCSYPTPSIFLAPQSASLDEPCFFLAWKIWLPWLLPWRSRAPCPKWPAFGLPCEVRQQVVPWGGEARSSKLVPLSQRLWWSSHGPWAACGKACEVLGSVWDCQLLITLKIQLLFLTCHQCHSLCLCVACTHLCGCVHTCIGAVHVCICIWVWTPESYTPLYPPPRSSETGSLTQPQLSVQLNWLCPATSTGFRGSRHHHAQLGCGWVLGTQTRPPLLCSKHLLTNLPSRSILKFVFYSKVSWAVKTFRLVTTGW